MTNEGRVALVLSGGGARGAYEIGALSCLLPALDKRGWRPSILVGTSVGAINAAHLAASRHLDVQEAIDGSLALWREVTEKRVVRPLLGPGTLLRALGGASRALSGSPVRGHGLLDSSPLAASLQEWVDWESLHRNVEQGITSAVAVVAAAARSGHSVAFVEGRLESGGYPSHMIDYFPTRLREVHVRASTAIPVLFPPVRVEDPPDARGWYFDGGTRLNTPIKPALDLGAERLVVIGTDAVTETRTHSGRHDSEPPGAGGALHLLQGSFVVDPLIDDLRRLGDVNKFFAGDADAPAARRHRAARGKAPYRQVPYIFIAPDRRGMIGELAIEVYRGKYRRVRALQWPDLMLLGRLLGDESPMSGELLSYLFFDPDFIEAVIALGREDARRWLGQPTDPDDPWRLQPLDAFIATTRYQPPGRPRQGGGG